MPDFPLAARVRAEPALERVPAAVLEGPANAPRLAAVTLEARAAGLRPGQSVPQARALLPEALLRPRDPLAERAAEQALREAAESFSPRISGEGPGLFFLDITGEPAGDCSLPACRDAIASRPKELALAEGLAARARAAGLWARVGVADSRAAARAAAELRVGAAESSQGAPVLIPPGGAAAFLAPQPVRCLHPSPELAARLARWGIATAGALAELRAGDVSLRLGPEGLALHRAARGLDSREFVPEPHPTCFFEGKGFDWPLCELEPFARAAGEVLERLAARLASRGLACRALEVTLALDPEGRDTRALSLAAPTRDAKVWLGLLALELRRRPPKAPVAGVWASATPEESRLVQLTLFGPPAASPDKVSTTLARLSSHLGAERVGTPEAVDSHRPESYALGRYEPEPPSDAPAPLEAPGHIALRVLRPRVALTVRADAQGRPGWLAGPEAEIRGSVRVASGPWRVEDGWWTEEAVCREYWDVELSDGALYRIFLDPARNAWFADGIYD
ncbi:MAG: DNA polymerase Y family protein [Elusimicrobia bacterium]|nr:DNA polymerase Y family protein [Elusimicrobiota bacterium]